MKRIKIGFLPTRRSIFSAPDAIKYANLTRKRLEELGIEFVDITDVNEEGLFYDEADREKIQEKFRTEKVKGIFMPHCNFGTEYVCARLAKEMNLPVLLWAPGMKDRMRMVSGCVTASADCLLPVRSAQISCPLYIYDKLPADGSGI